MRVMRRPTSMKRFLVLIGLVISLAVLARSVVAQRPGRGGPPGSAGLSTPPFDCSRRRWRRRTVGQGDRQRVRGAAPPLTKTKTASSHATNSCRASREGPGRPEHR